MRNILLVILLSATLFSCELDKHQKNLCWFWWDDPECGGKPYKPAESEPEEFDKGGCLDRCHARCDKREEGDKECHDTCSDRCSK